MKSILLTGIGGQGTVLAAKIITTAALTQGADVRSTETIGMAQRGGSVVSHVRYTESPDETIFSPMVPLGGADCIIGFEPGEVLRTLPYLRPGGTIVVAQAAIPPVTAALTRDPYDGSEALAYLETLADTDRVGNFVAIDGASITKQLGSAKVLNVALLGAACATGALGFSQQEIRDALMTSVKPQYAEMNCIALEAGARIADVTTLRWR